MFTDRPTTSRLYANRYRSVRLLGKGNFGQVYLVEDVKAKDKSLVEKVLKRITVGENVSTDNDSLEAVQEAKLMQKLQHPCIVQFYDSFLDDEFFCIVTEFCEGGDLDVYLNKLKKNNDYLEEQQILTWFVELVCALQYIHSRGVLHRDLKTRNIFIRRGMLKLGDFGISRILMTTSDMASTFVGTPYYMSPEVLKHDGYNSKSDIWSLGCIVVEMCTLDRPFGGTNIMNVMWNIMQKEVPRIPSRYSSQLQYVADWILDRDPQNRPSALEILQYDYVAAHVRKLSSKQAEIAQIVGSLPSTNASSKSDAAVIRSSTKDRVTLEQLRKEEKEKKLGNLDPRERRRIRKQEEAEQQAAKLNAAARENLARVNESKQRKLNDLRGTLTQQQLARSEQQAADNRSAYGRSSSSDNAEDQPISARRRPADRALSEQSEYDNPNDRDYEHHARGYDDTDAPGGMLENLRAKYSQPPRRDYDQDDSDIPDDPYLAETHYGEEQFDSDGDGREEHDEDEDEDEGYEQTVRARSDDSSVRDMKNMLANLETQLQISEPIDSRPVSRNERPANQHAVVKTRDEVDAYGPQMRDVKMKNMRSRAIGKLGEAKFNRVYDYLKDARADGQPDEAVIANTLRKIAGPELYGECFIVDQLVFFESQS